MSNLAPQGQREKKIPVAMTRLREEAERNKKLVEELLIDMDPVLRTELKDAPPNVSETRSTNSGLEAQLFDVIDHLIDSNRYLEDIIRRIEI